MTCDTINSTIPDLLYAVWDGPSKNLASFGLSAVCIGFVRKTCDDPAGTEEGNGEH
jgi:hypothetical protein